MEYHGGRRPLELEVATAAGENSLFSNGESRATLEGIARFARGIIAAVDDRVTRMEAEDQHTAEQLASIGFEHLHPRLKRTKKAAGQGVA